jgi:trigger factor
VKSAVETLTPTRVKLTVEVPFEELKPSLDAAYKKIAQQINVPGFRRGKVPAPVIDRQVGRGTVLDEAINDALPKVYVEALQSNDLSPVAQPEIEITKFEDNTTLEFSAEVDVRPSLTLPSFDGLEVSVEPFPVADEDVTEQIDFLRERFGTLLDVERPAADGDFVTIDLVATEDGQVVPGADMKGISYRVGRGGMVDGLDEALVGMAAGDSKTFASTLVGGDSVGHEVQIQVNVGGVKEQQLPDLDDEFAQMASEFDTVAELTDDVRSRLERGKRLEQAAAARDAVMEKMLDMVEVPLPDSVVTDELNQRRQSVEQQLAYAGMTMQAYLDSEKTTIDEFEADLEKRVRDAVAAQFVLDQLARSLELGVSQEELTQHMLRRAQESGEDPNEYMRHMIDHNHLPELMSEIVRGKALAQVVETATVVDTAGAPVDLKNLMPDGSIAEPAPESTDTPGEPAAEEEKPAKKAAKKPAKKAAEKAE